MGFGWFALRRELTRKMELGTKLKVFLMNWGLTWDLDGSRSGANWIRKMELGTKIELFLENWGLKWDLDGSRSGANWTRKM